MNETDVVKFDFRSCVYTTHTVYVCNDPNKKKVFPYGNYICLGKYYYKGLRIS